MRQLDLVPPFMFNSKMNFTCYTCLQIFWTATQRGSRVAAPNSLCGVPAHRPHPFFSLDIPHCQAQSFSHDLLPGLTPNYTYEKHIRLHVTHENKFRPFQCNLIADCTQSYLNRFPIFWCFPGNPDWIFCTQTFHHHGSPVYTWSSKREHALNF